MRKSVYAAIGALAATCAAPSLGQSGAQTGAGQSAAGGSCYIEVQSLMTEGGIEDLAVAMRRLDDALRPQVQEIQHLKQEIARLELPRAQGVQLASDTVSDEFDEPRTLLNANRNDPTAARLQRMMAQLDARQVQLKRSYGEQMRAIMGPVQARLGERASAFGAERGCSAMKMARAQEASALRSQGARNLTRDFVGWFPANKG